ncbi:MAG: DCC1-like thiol-disulfide oxidoreductase family protein [Acidimicrobiales bacterium]
MDSLTVVYDEHCELCRRCRQWLSMQELLVPLYFLAAGSPAARERYGDLEWHGAELMVVADDGQAWVGPPAFLMCLWATRRYRRTAHRFRAPLLAPMIESFFHGLSSNRSLVSGMLRSHRCDGDHCQSAAG